jgi:hypothetical protein
VNDATLTRSLVTMIRINDGRTVDGRLTPSVRLRLLVLPPGSTVRVVLHVRVNPTEPMHQEKDGSEKLRCKLMN